MHAAGGNDIEFLFDWSDHDCIVKRPLKFDFYIPDLGILIEYNGIQHYEPSDMNANTIEYELTDSNSNTIYIFLIKIHYFFLDGKLLMPILTKLVFL